METAVTDKDAQTPSNPKVFYSIFDPQEDNSKPPVKTSLLEPIPKKMDFGSVIYSSKLNKKAKNVGFSISRYFFLSATHLGYSKHDNPSKIKKCTELRNLKVSIDAEISKTVGLPKRHVITLFRSKVHARIATDKKEIADKWREQFSRFCVMTRFEDFYTVSEVLGKGAHGKVVLATNNKNGKNYAVKVFDKLQLITKLRGFDSIAHEVKVLRKLDHSNIIKLHEVYESISNVHIVLEYVQGGELYTKLKQRKFYPEPLCARLLKNILQTLAYLHDKGIVHRDIKPENMVLVSKDNDCEVKLVDFGFAIEADEQTDFKRCGTPGYVSPEVLNTQPHPLISTKIDIFSVGAIFFHLLTGSKLFSGTTVEEILKKNKKCTVETFKLDARKISPNARDLLFKMLEKDPAQRISAQEALKHPFIQNMPVSITEIAEDHEERSIGEISRYSFDMTHLKELNMYSQSKVMDSIGTFHITSHIPLDRQREAYEQERHYPHHLNEVSSPKSFYSYGVSSNYTSESSYESLEEGKFEEKSFSPKNASQRGTPRNGKKGWPSNTPTSCFHKAAIMNNIKKSQLIDLKQVEVSEGGDESFSDGFAGFLKKLDGKVDREENEPMT